MGEGIYTVAPEVTRGRKSWCIRNLLISKREQLRCKRGLVDGEGIRKLKENNLLEELQVRFNGLKKME